MWFPLIALNHWRSVHIRQLQEKCIEQQRPLYVAFINLTKAFDLVGRSGLFAILRRFGCPNVLLSIILKLHSDMHATVQVDGLRSGRFPIKRGVKQGCILLPPSLQFSSLPCSYVHFRNRLEYYCIVASPGNCLIFHVFVRSQKWDVCSFENCSMRTRLPLWQPPHVPFKTSAAPSLVPALNLILLSAWVRPWSYLNDRALPRKSVWTELCCSQSRSSVIWGQQSTAQTPWNRSLTFAQKRPRQRLVNFVHVFGLMATSTSELKSRCTWPVLSVCSSVVMKRGQRTGTIKNAVLTLFTWVVFALSWGCPSGTVCPTPLHCKRLVPTTSWPSSDIDVYDRLVMCAGWKTPSCQSKFCIANYPTHPDRLGVQNCVSGTWWNVT